MKKLLVLFISFMLLNQAAMAATQRFEVLCYHDVRDSVDADLEQETTIVSTKNLARHFAWLQAHGYHPVSLNDVLQAQAGSKKLPAKAVLLTFDDGYASFYTRVYPLLKLYGYPAVSALVGNWLQVPAGGMVAYGDTQVPRESFLSAMQIKEMSDSGLVEFASHSFDLHRGELANPQGNKMAAATTFSYNPQTQTYETEAEYQQRIRNDLSKNNAFISNITGKPVRAMVWPYGMYNQIVVDIAKGLGMPITLTLSEEERPNTDKLTQTGRYLVNANPNEMRLAEIERNVPAVDKQRVMQIDLDYLYDENPQQMAKNLDTLLDRVKSLSPSAVYLQAYSDTNGDGVAEALYFPNQHMPVRADLFSRVAWQLMTRANVRVYAWMPVLAFELNDKQKQAELQVVSAQGKASAATYQRLSPFAPEARRIIKDIYRDLGQHAKFSGVVFHDDAVLSDTEDDSVFARAVYAKELHSKTSVTEIAANPKLSNRLMFLKSRWLTEFTLELAQELERYLPELKTARNMYAAAMLNPKSEQWLSQNYSDFLNSYDYTAVMAMPQMEGAENAQAWLQQLVSLAKQQKNGLKKTIFEIQTKDWKTKKPLADSQITQELETILAAGGVHLGYYPDDFLKNQPNQEAVRGYISSRNFPYLMEAK